MLAVAGELPGGPGWAFEVKWDGLRGQARIADGRVGLRSRSGQLVSDRFPELADPPAGLGGREVVLDGELVVVDSVSGRPDFPAVAARLHQQPTAAALAAVPVVFVAFDVLWADGAPLLGDPYGQRLEGLDLAGTWQATPAFEDAEAAWAAIAAHELEGLVAKRIDSRYTPGRRAGSWVKRKAWTTTCGLRVVGWRPHAPPSRSSSPSTANAGCAWSASWSGASPGPGGPASPTPSSPCTRAPARCLVRCPPAESAGSPRASRPTSATSAGPPQASCASPSRQPSVSVRAGGDEWPVSDAAERASGGQGSRPPLESPTGD